MENEVSKKIRLLLNEVAILNQPELIEGKFIYQLDTLSRIKSLSAELYLLADQSLFHIPSIVPSVSGDVNSPEIQALKEEPVALKEEVVSPVLPEKEPEPVAETVPEITLSIPVSEPPALPEIPVVPVVITPEPPAIEPMVEEKTVSVNEIAAKDGGEAIAAKISLTRRFEYINNLFSGDSAAFMWFLNEFSAKGNAENSMQFFDDFYHEKNWKRKAESASDLKQLLRKMI